MVKLLRDFFHTELVAREQETSDNQTDGSTNKQREHAECPTSTAKLLFANKTESDIWWKDEMRQIAKMESERWVLLFWQQLVCWKTQLTKFSLHNVVKHNLLAKHLN